MENSVENKEQSGGRGVGTESGGESAVKYRLTGRVQQIGFRNYLAAAAEELQVRGWAKNESDESLVVFMQGAPAALSAMTPLLRQGPRGAAVNNLAELMVEETDSVNDGFHIL